MAEIVKEFQGEYRFLSNFYMREIDFLGLTYPSSEHLFQAMKATDPRDAEKIRLAKTPSEAKRFGKTINRRKDWDDVRITMMYLVLKLKFQDQELKEKLLATGDAVLEEGNSWNDMTWGKCLTTGIGKNYLGKILMKVRKELKK